MIKYIIYTILFTLTISPLVAQDIGADQTIPMDPDIRIGKLDNGLTYYIRHSENPKNRGILHCSQRGGHARRGQPERLSPFPGTHGL